MMQELRLVRGDGFSHAGLEADVRGLVHHLHIPIAPLEEKAHSSQSYHFSLMPCTVNAVVFPPRGDN